MDDAGERVEEKQKLPQGGAQAGAHAVTNSRANLIYSNLILRGCTYYARIRLVGSEWPPKIHPTSSGRPGSGSFSGSGSGWLPPSPYGPWPPRPDILLRMIYRLFMEDFCCARVFYLISGLEARGDTHTTACMDILLCMIYPPFFILFISWIYNSIRSKHSYYVIIIT